MDFIAMFMVVLLTFLLGSRFVVTTLLFSQYNLSSFDYVVSGFFPLLSYGYKIKSGVESTDKMTPSVYDNYWYIFLLLRFIIIIIGLYITYLYNKPNPESGNAIINYIFTLLYPIINLIYMGVTWPKA